MLDQAGSINVVMVMQPVWQDTASYGKGWVSSAWST